MAMAKKFGKSGGGKGGMKSSGKANAKHGGSGALLSTPSNVGKCAKQMASRGMTLDSPPPPPPGLGGQAPQGNLQNLSGQDGNQGVDPSLQQDVIAKLAIADQSMQQAAQIMPELAPVLADLRQQMKAKVGSVLFKDQSGGGTPPPAGGMNPLAALVQSAASQTPTS